MKQFNINLRIYQVLSHFLIFNLINSLEYGMIAYFEKECPNGWVEFSKSSGRVIIGQGGTTDSNGNEKQFEVGELSGEFSHIMTLQELVSHIHKTGLHGWGNLYGGGTLIDICGATIGSAGLYSDSNTSTTGGGQPFNIMQPYIVMVACKYIGQEGKQATTYDQNYTDLIELINSNKVLLQTQIQQMQQTQNTPQMQLDIYQLQLKSIQDDISYLKDKIDKNQNDQSDYQKEQYRYNIISVFTLISLSFYFIILLILKFANMINNRTISIFRSMTSCFSSSGSTKISKSQNSQQTRTP